MRCHCLAWALLGLALLPTAAAQGTLPLLGEVHYDAAGADGPAVFTELRGPPGLSLDGFRLEGVNGGDGAVYRTIPLDGLTVPDDGLLVLATPDATCWVRGAADAFAPVDWQNGPDSVVLVQETPLGPLTVDALGYGEGAPVYETAPAPEPVADGSLTRDAAGTDTQDNARDFGEAEPSPGLASAPAERFPDTDSDCVPDPEDNCPGIPNPDQTDADSSGTGDACEPPVPVPEPGTVVLSLAGLASVLLVAQRRRRG